MTGKKSNMPNRNYEKGRRYEYKIKKELEKQGYTVLRTSGSHGFADLVAVKPKEIRFIQCKAQKAAKKEITKLLAYAGLTASLASVSVEMIEKDKKDKGGQI